MMIMMHKNKCRIQQTLLVTTVVVATVVVGLANDGTTRASANMHRRLSCLCWLEGAGVSSKCWWLRAALQGSPHPGTTASWRRRVGGGWVVCLSGLKAHLCSLSIYLAIHLSRSEHKSNALWWSLDYFCGKCGPRLKDPHIIIGSNVCVQCVCVCACVRQTHCSQKASGNFFCVCEFGTGQRRLGNVAGSLTGYDHVSCYFLKLSCYFLKVSQFLWYFLMF